MSEFTEAVFYPAETHSAQWRELVNVYGVHHGLFGLAVDVETSRPSTESAALTMRAYLAGKVPNSVVESVTADWFDPKPMVRVSPDELTALVANRAVGG